MQRSALHGISRIYMAGPSKVRLSGSPREHQELINSFLKKAEICPPPVIIFTFGRSDSNSILQTSFVPEHFRRTGKPRAEEISLINVTS